MDKFECLPNSFNIRVWPEITGTIIYDFAGQIYSRVFLFGNFYVGIPFVIFQTNIVFRLFCSNNVCFGDKRFYIRISNDIINQLKELGHQVELHPDFDNYFGGAQGIIISKDGELDGGADSRRDGVAIGY